MGGGALYCARPRAECGRCVDAAAAMPARNSVWIISHCRPRHSSSIAMQHNAMLPSPLTRLLQHRTIAHAAASSTPAPTAAWGRHSVPNSWQASHGTPALRDWPMNTFQDFCSTNPYLSVKFSLLGESWWAETDCTSMTYNHTRAWSFKLS